MSTRKALDMRYYSLKKSIAILLSVKEALSINYGLRYNAMRPALSLCHLEDELSLKQHELEELQKTLHLD